MSEFDYYEIVDVLDSSDARALGVGDTRDVVVGISGDTANGKYAVLIRDKTYMPSPSDLVLTGESVDREAIYGGKRSMFLLSVI